MNTKFNTQYLVTTAKKIEFDKIWSDFKEECSKAFTLHNILTGWFIFSIISLLLLVGWKTLLIWLSISVGLIVGPIYFAVVSAIKRLT